MKQVMMRMLYSGFLAMAWTVFGVLSAMGGTSGSDGTWIWRDGVGTSPTNAANWFDSANWVDGVIPEGTGSAAIFPSETTSATQRYVTFDRDLSLCRITSSTAKLRLLGEGTLSLHGTGNVLKYATVYANVEWPVLSSGDAYCSKVNFCGDVICPSDGRFILSDSVTHRLDLYANEAGSDRVNPTATGVLGNSYSEYPLYAPRSSETDQTSVWTATEGSRFLTRDTTREKHVLCAGTTVSDGGHATFAAGTFLRRIFDDDTIELSAPAARSGAVTLTFAAFRPNVTQTLAAWKKWNNTASPLSFNKYAAEDGLRIEIDLVARHASTMTSNIVTTKSGYHPGTVSLKDVSGGDGDMRFFLGTCHVEFRYGDEGAGIPRHDVAVWGKQAQVRLTTPSGVAASLKCLDNVNATSLTKDGRGRLTVPLVAKECPVHFAELTVAEGTLDLSDTDEGVPLTADTLTVGSGAALFLPTQGVWVTGEAVLSGERRTGPLLVTLPKPTGTNTLYVAPGGDDTACGNSADQALKTLAEAFDRARTGVVPAVIRLAAGTYESDEPLALSRIDGNLTVVGPDDGQAVVSAGRRITGWTIDACGWWHATAPEGAKFSQFYVNGERRTRPFLPREGYYFIDRACDDEGKTYESFYLKPGDMPGGDPSDFEFCLFQTWTMSRSPVVAYDVKTRRVTIGITPFTQSWAVPSPQRWYRIDNVRSALGEPGDWYLDRGTREIIYVPKDGETPATCETTASWHTHALSADGVRNVTFRRVVFAYGDDGMQPAEENQVSQAATYRPAMVQIEGGSDVRFENCAFLHTGAYALAFVRSHAGGAAVGCEFYDLGAGGVKIGDGYDRKSGSELVRGCTVEDCIVSGGGRVEPAGAGIWIGHALSNRVSHCTIHDLYYSGISCGWNWSFAETARDNVLEWNHIYDVGRHVLSDLGGIYVLGSQPGTVERYNHIHHVTRARGSAFGVYFDSGTAFVTVTNCVTHDCDDSNWFLARISCSNRVENCVFGYGLRYQLNCPSPDLAAGAQPTRFARNLLIWDDTVLTQPFSCRTQAVHFADNLYWCPDGVRPSSELPGFTYGDPGFRDAPNRDFTLVEGAAALGIGFIPFSLDGCGSRLSPSYTQGLAAPPDVLFAAPDEPTEAPVPGEGTWIWRDGVGTSPTNAADYFERENWVDGIVADGEDMEAVFPAVGRSVTRYIGFSRDVVTENLSVSADTTLILPPQGASAEVFERMPTPGVTGDPAFWFDFSEERTLTLGQDASGRETVDRVDDVRKGLAEYDQTRNYMHAAKWNVCGPRLVRDADGRAQHAMIHPNADAPDDPAQQHVLRWSRTLTGIRAVFKVLCAVNGGGQFLGNTADRDDWTRGAGCLWNDGLFDAGAAQSFPHVRNGRFYFNGQRRDPAEGYLYPGGTYVADSEECPSTRYPRECLFVPQLVEAHTLGDATADCFGAQGAADCSPARAGRERIYECLVYTNALTETERLQIAGYLMKKWLNAEIDYSCTDEAATLESVSLDSATLLQVDEGDAVRVRTVGGSGSFVKDGAGGAYVDDFAAPGATLDVRGGAVTIWSDDVQASDLPQGAYLHLDASDPESLTTNGQQVTAWRDVRGEGRPVATRHAGGSPVLLTDHLHGMPYVDFGLSGVETQDGDSASSALEFTPCNDLRTACVVWGLGARGNQIVGSVGTGGAAPTAERAYLWRSGGGCRDGTLLSAESPCGYADADFALGRWTPGASYGRLNGADAAFTETLPTCAGDVIAMATVQPFYGDCFGETVSADATYCFGAQRLGEAILYRESLAPPTVRLIEAYLLKKWHGVSSPGFRPAELGSVRIAAEARLVIRGRSPLTVAAVSGAGTVEGALAVTGGVWTVETDGGAVVPLAVDGTLALTEAGVVSLDLPAGTPVGLCRIVACTRITGMDLSRWRVVFAQGAADSRSVRLRLRSDGLYVDGRSPGAAVVVH